MFQYWSHLIQRKPEYSQRIDLVVVDPIGKEAWVYELKKDVSRYDEASFKEKVDTMVAQTPELRKMTIHIGLLTKEDM